MLELVRSKFFELWGHPGDGNTDTDRNVAAKLKKLANLEEDLEVIRKAVRAVREEYYGNGLSVVGSKGYCEMHYYSVHKGSEEEGNLAITPMTLKQRNCFDRAFNGLFGEGQSKSCMAYIVMTNFDKLKKGEISREDFETVLEYVNDLFPGGEDRWERFRSTAEKWMGKFVKTYSIYDGERKYPKIY